MDVLPQSEVDLHRLELRFSATRLSEPRAIESLARSIAHCGQIVACIAVAEQDGQALVLVDGYRRIQALRRLGRDTALVEPWQCDLVAGLLRVLANTGTRPWAAIEQALLLRELVAHYGLSQHEVARRCGRDVSWVSRRLELVSGLPEALLEAVRCGTVSTWAATRVLAPLARANGEHATALLQALGSTPLSTRQLQRWFEHYQRAPRTLRERLVAQPGMFVQALAVRDQRGADTRLRDGPEGTCQREARQIGAIAARLRARLRQLAAVQPLSDTLVSALAALVAPLTGLQHDLQRYCHDDAKPDSRGGAHAASARPRPASDRPSAEAVP
ncbi:MAG: ParB N-terminal domain-containing protein [Burkholderiaceae bacterium]